MPKRATPKLDKEESDIMTACDKGLIDTRTPSRRTLQSFSTAADNALKKARSINIRLSDHDLVGIQRKAAEKGLPYQTLSAGLIHQFVEGELVERKNG